MVEGSKSSFSQLFAVLNFVLVFPDFWDLALCPNKTQGFENWIYFRHQVGRWRAAKVQISLHLDNDTHFSRPAAEFLCKLFIL